MFKIQVAGTGDGPVEASMETTKITVEHEGSSVDLTHCVSSVQINIEAFKHVTAQVCLYPNAILIENPTVILSALSNQPGKIMDNLSGIIFQYEHGSEVYISKTGEITCTK